MTTIERSDSLYNDWVIAQCDQQPNAIAVHDLHSNRVMSYKSFNERVESLSSGLSQFGIVTGDRVAYLGLNSSDTLEIFAATQRIGAIYVPLNFRLTADELSYIINDAKPSLLICDTEFSHVSDAVKEQLLWLEIILTQCDGSSSGYESLMIKQASQCAAVTGDDTAMIMYSSGTTGRPKGVIYTRRMILACAVNIQQTSEVTEHSVFLNVMPLFHIGGMQSVLTALYSGCKIVMARSFDPEQMLLAINDPSLGITNLGAVPAIWNALAAHPLCDSTDFSRIRSAATGAESVPPALLTAWMQRGVVLREVYGLTETSGIICMTRARDLPQKLGYTSPPLRYCQFKVMRSETEAAEPGELGEVWMRGAMVTPGYWQREDATAEAFHEGWFRSGDIGKVDADGCLAIEDRIKDMYISGGENVYPAEVEAVLYEMDAITEVAIIGVPDAKWGEVGCAVIALKPGHEMNLADIHAQCENRLAKYKWPRSIRVMDSLPRNSTGKVQKFLLRQNQP